MGVTHLWLTVQAFGMACFVSNSSNNVLNKAERRPREKLLGHLRPRDKRTHLYREGMNAKQEKSNNRNR